MEKKRQTDVAAFGVESVIISLYLIIYTIYYIAAAVVLAVAGTNPVLVIRRL